MRCARRRRPRGRDQVALELVAPARANRARLGRVAERRARSRRRPVAAQRPEVVPVRIGRLVGIALVADRGGIRPEQRSRPGARGWRRCARFGAAAPCRRRTRCTCGQWRASQRASRVWRQISATAYRYSPWLSFSATGSAPRASTQHGTLPTGEDEAGVPVDELARAPRPRPGAASRPPSSRRRAPSCARRSACPGCSAGPSRDIRMCASERAQRVGDRLRVGRQRQRDAVQALAPVLRGDGVESAHRAPPCVDACRLAGVARRAAQSSPRCARRRGCRCDRRSGSSGRRRATCGSSQRGERRSGVCAEHVEHARPLSNGARHGDVLRRSCRERSACGRRPASMPPAQRAVRCIGLDAARRRQELLRRVDLPRPQRERQRQAARLSLGIDAACSARAACGASRCAVGGGLDRRA